MFTPEQLRALHLRIFDRMVELGWLRNYTETVGKGFHLGWTSEGAARAIRLRSLAGACGLQQHDLAPVLFLEGPDGARLRGLGWVWPWKELEAAETDRARGAFKSLVEELGIHDEDGLIVLVGIGVEWAPDGETRVRFE